MREMVSQNPAFQVALSYRRYRLLNTDQYRGPDVTEEMARKVKRIKAVMRSRKFDVSDQITILEFVFNSKETIRPGQGQRGR